MEPTSVAATSLPMADKDPPISHTQFTVPITSSDKNKTTHTMERTFIILKPDCLQNKHAGDVISRFESAGFFIIACKMTRLSDVVLREHYAHLAHLPFFSEIIDFMSSSPVILMILEGENCVAHVREILGATDSQAAAPGTIRKTYGTDKMRNIAHASDSPQNAKIEMRRFFKADEICNP
ncbi:MAG: nucleoside-diphosphate kinase [Puniceicoccales bacterium]|nr:nucleoside-diphosphate kinase [Puniceicoccales bacterium]